MYYVQQIDRMNAPTLGAKWYERLWADTTSAASSALDIYGKSKQTEAYKEALAKLTTPTQENITKWVIIGGVVIAAAVILTKKRT